MANTQTQTKESLEMVQEQMQIFTDYIELTTYEITEKFPKFGERKYYACNLEMEFHNDIVMLTDAEGIISMDGTRVSNGFAIANVKNVTMKSLDIKDMKMNFRFDFKDGYIDIVSKRVTSSLAPLDEKFGQVLSEEDDLKEIANTYQRYFNMSEEELDKAYREFYNK
jgi:hypothetical protein